MTLADIKISQASGISPPAWDDIILTPDPNTLIGFDDDKRPQIVRMGSNMQIVNGLLESLGGIPGSGTVYSVGLSLPSIFSVTGSPVTTTGTLTAALAVQAANKVFAGPATGANAAPAFRSLVAADLPATGVTPGSYSAANITVDAQGRITAAANGGGGGGTVTAVSVTTANGISGSVADATTTPAISLTLGAITPTSVNGLTISTTTGTLSIANGKIVTFSNRLTFTGTDNSTLNIGVGGTLGSAAFAATTAFQPADADLTALAALTGTNTLYFRSATSTWTPVAFGTNLEFSGGTLSMTGGGGNVSNTVPLTDDQLVVGAGGGDIKILAAGDEGFVLTIVGGIPAWTEGGGGGSGTVINDGDLDANQVVVGAGVAHCKTLAAGSDGFVLTMVDGAPAWAEGGGGGGGSPGGDPGTIQFNASGTFGGITNATTDGDDLYVTYPRIISGIKDSFGNELLKFTPTTDAVNEITIVNTATGDRPIIKSSGSDSNVGLRLQVKGAGPVEIYNSLTRSQLAINSAGDNCQIFFQIGDNNKSGISTSAGTDDIIVGSVSNDLCFRSYVSKGFLFSTDDGATAGFHIIAANGGVATDAPTGGSVGAWKLGTFSGGTVRVEIDGVAYLLTAVAA